MSFTVREKRATDASILTEVWTRNWGGVSVVSRGHVHHPLDLPCCMAVENDTVIGAITWNRAGDEIEIVTLDSWREDQGVGTALLNRAIDSAKKSDVRRAWLITTNDNIRAIRFYQKRGWDLMAVHRDAVREARKLKPTIPELGDHGIPIRHELEFELYLSTSER